MGIYPKWPIGTAVIKPNIRTILRLIRVSPRVESRVNIARNTQAAHWLAQASGNYTLR